MRIFRYQKIVHQSWHSSLGAAGTQTQPFGPPFRRFLNPVSSMIVRPPVPRSISYFPILTNLLCCAVVLDDAISEPNALARSFWKESFVHQVSAC
jgi:hypothetical protein